jgi:CRP/FNR family transcriptional regulator
MGTVLSVKFRESEPLAADCPNCGFIGWSLPANLASRDTQRFNDLIVHNRPVRRGSYIYRAGSELGSLFVICSGFLKSSLTHEDGRDQVTGFSMTGELVGLGAIGTGRHVCDTVALEDTSLCGMRYADFAELGHAVPALEHHFHRILSAEISRHHEIMFLLGSMCAEERVAVFLLNFARRFLVRGYSGTHFRLPMGRREIASYVGLKLETVSRTLSHFHDIDLVTVRGKDIEIRDMARLRRVMKTRQ